MIEGNRICIAVSSRQRHPSSEGFAPPPGMRSICCAYPAENPRLAVDVALRVQKALEFETRIRALSHHERMTFKARAFGPCTMHAVSLQRL